MDETNEKPFNNDGSFFLAWKAERYLRTQAERRVRALWWWNTAYALLAMVSAIVLIGFCE